MKKSYIKLNGKKYSVRKFNGKIWIEGKKLDEFLDELDPITLMELSRLGQIAIIDEIRGTKPHNYQKMMDRSYLIKKANAN